MGDMFLGYAVILRHHAAVTVVAVSRRVPTMKISARNQIEGVVKKIEKGEVASTVKIEIAEPAILTSMLTKEAVEDLDLKEGDKVEAVIKATEILILKE